MADMGPFLTSCIIFYLSVGAAIFQILEESNWISAKDKYIQAKEDLLKNYACLTKEGLEEILEIVSEAAGQGVTITGERHRNTWDWPNSVIFAASIVTTIGYGNVAPKTKGGRVFCILYGLFGIPLCLVWISRLGSFFGDRAKRLSGILINKGVSVKKVQITCTAIFLLWGLFMHLLIPPLVFKSMEGWSYLEGIYFSFITLTTVGFGDYVAGVNPNIEYPRLYRVFAELWIYMGLAWLSLFFSWKVNMVVEAHKEFRKRRLKHRQFYYEEPKPEDKKKVKDEKRKIVDIFEFQSKPEENYCTIIKEIGMTEKTKQQSQNINRSKSCSDISGHDIKVLDHSPRRRKIVSISELFSNVRAEMDQSKSEQEVPTISEIPIDAEPPVTPRTDEQEHKDSSSLEPNVGGLVFTVPAKDVEKEKSVQHPDGGETRFVISKVTEKDDDLNNAENG